eukprot:COSAG03_NODE_1448_length_4069_cov_2.374055_1_plen_398_part_10
MDMILRLLQLNQVRRFEGQRIQVACQKTVVDRPDSGKNTSDGDGGASAEEILQRTVSATHLDCVAAEEIASAKLTTENRDMGESHYFLWDTTRFRLDEGIKPCSLAGTVPKCQWHRAPAMIVLRQASATPVTARLVILSVHLKSGGKAPTQNEVKQLSTDAVPYVQALLDAGRDDHDTIVIVGDFNLNPHDEAFSGLREAGFRYMGESGVATNQHEWLLAEEEKAFEVYDSAWVWHRQGSAVGRSWVWEDADLGIALEDRNSLVDKLSAVVDAQGFRSEVGRELRESGVLSSAVKKAVMTQFKSKVNKDWSDHKPFGISLPLPSVEPEPEPELETEEVDDEQELQGEGMTVEAAELERLRVFKTNVQRMLGIEQGLSEEAILAKLVEKLGESTVSAD